jgi:hypothetical protein
MASTMMVPANLFKTREKFFKNASVVRIQSGPANRIISS